MKRIAACILLMAIVLCPVISRAKDPARKNGMEVMNFDNEDLTAVFLKLGKEAGISLFLAPEVKGTVTVRLENKTPLEAIEIITENTGYWFHEEKGGIYSVRVMPPVIEFEDEDVSKVLFQLAKQTGISIVTTEHVSGTISLRLEKALPGEALDIVMKSRGYVLYKDKHDVYYVGPAAEVKKVEKMTKPE